MFDSYFGLRSSHVITENEKGKLVIGEIRNDGDTRVFIVSLSIFTNYYTKDGWWDTFSYTRQDNLKAGYYFFVIREFRHDKNGNLNMVLKPKKYIGNNKSIFTKYGDVFYLFGQGNMLSEYYTDYFCAKQYSLSDHFTISNLDGYEDGYGMQHLSNKYLGKFIEDEISIEELNGLIHEENYVYEWKYSEWENRKKYIVSSWKKWKDIYPLAYKKICNTEKTIDAYLHDMYWVYQGLLKEGKVAEEGIFFNEETGKMDLLAIVESIARYYKEKNTKDKANKRKGES